MLKLKKNGDYYYLFDDKQRVAGLNPKGKMWGITKYFREFDRMVREGN